MFTAATDVGGDAQRRLLGHCADAGELGTATGAQHNTATVTPKQHNVQRKRLTFLLKSLHCDCVEMPADFKLRLSQQLLL